MSTSSFLFGGVRKSVYYVVLKSMRFSLKLPTAKISAAFVFCSFKILTVRLNEHSKGN